MKKTEDYLPVRSLTPKPSFARCAFPIRYVPRHDAPVFMKNLGNHMQTANIQSRIPRRGNDSRSTADHQSNKCARCSPPFSFTENEMQNKTMSTVKAWRTAGVIGDQRRARIIPGFNPGSRRR